MTAWGWVWSSRFWTRKEVRRLAEDNQDLKRKVIALVESASDSEIRTLIQLLESELKARRPQVDGQGRNLKYIED